MEITPNNNKLNTKKQNRIESVGKYQPYDTTSIGSEGAGSSEKKNK